MISNTTITREDFDKMVEHNNLQVFTPASVNEYVRASMSIEKSEDGEDPEEIAKAVAEELKTLNKIDVLEVQENGSLERITMFYRQNETTEG